MTKQQIRELCKAIAYGVAKEVIADMYGISADEVKKIAEENQNTIREIIEHYVQIGG